MFDRRGRRIDASGDDASIPCYTHNPGGTALPAVRNCTKNAFPAYLNPRIPRPNSHQLLNREKQRPSHLLPAIFKMPEGWLLHVTSFLLSQIVAIAVVTLISHQQDERERARRGTQTPRPAIPHRAQERRSEIVKWVEEIGDQDHCKATEQLSTCAPRLTMQNMFGTRTLRQEERHKFEVAVAQMRSRRRHLFQSSPVLERHWEQTLSNLLGKPGPRGCFSRAISSSTAARRLLMLMTGIMENCNRSIGILHMARFRLSELSRYLQEMGCRVAWLSKQGI